jgi:hypothetical protein
MPTMSVLMGGAAGALITFLLTTYRRWWRRRRLAEDAAKRLAPQLQTLSTAITGALAAYSWEPLDTVEPPDHSMPRLTKQVIDGLRQGTAEPFTDGLFAVHELDRARETVTLVAPHQRERVEDYRRRIDVAGAIASAVANGERGHPQHDHY